MSIIKEVKKEEANFRKKLCIVCKEPAEFCMRGIPDNTYCRKCAKEYFKLLGYLDKLK